MFVPVRRTEATLSAVRPFLLAALLAAAGAPLAAQGAKPGTARILRGQVTDSLGFPVPLAEVAILGSGLSAVADSEGLFRITDVPIGLHAVIVRSIGWKPYFFFIRMGENEELVGRIGMVPAPQQLPEIIVQGRRFAKPPEYAFTHRYDGFFQRRLAHSGTFRLRSDPVFQSAFHAGDLLRDIPGVRVSFGMGGVPMVTFTRCRGSNTKVSVWIDGFRTIASDPNEALSWIRASEVEMIEVYRGLGEIPGEFMNDECAAIVIWTR